MTATTQSETFRETASFNALWPVFGAGAVLGPVLVLASSVAWVADAPSVRFVLQFYGACAVALGLVGASGRLGNRMPRTGALLAATSLLGFGGGGIGFAVDGLTGHLFGSASLADEGGLAGALAPTLPGLLGPLSVVALGAVLLRTRQCPTWNAVGLVVGGVLFPVSRIGEIPVLAVADDLVILAALVPLGLSMLARRPLGA
jgi:hypothetical protein